MKRRAKKGRRSALAELVCTKKNTQKYRGTPQGLQPQKKLKYRSTPQGLQLHKKKTEAPKGFALQKLIKTTAPRKDATAEIQKHPAGFATAETHPEGFVLPKWLTCTAAPNGGSAEVVSQ